MMLSLCDTTTIMAKPWAQAGIDSYCVDINHPAGVTQVDDHLFTVGADLRRWVPPLQRCVFVAAFPPCDNLAVSGAQWMRGKGISGLITGLEIVERCRAICRASGAPWMIENPRSTLSTYWRDPDYRFHPFEFGGYLGGQDDNYTKDTWLWTSDDFVMPAKNPLENPDPDRIANVSNTPERPAIRAATPAGFARAIFEANRP